MNVMLKVFYLVWLLTQHTLMHTNDSRSVLSHYFKKVRYYLLLITATMMKSVLFERDLTDDYEDTAKTQQ